MTVDFPLSDFLIVSSFSANLLLIFAINFNSFLLPILFSLSSCSCFLILFVTICLQCCCSVISSLFIAVYASNAIVSKQLLLL
jgi:hypothetical protein